jgi:hypothetical protein
MKQDSSTNDALPKRGMRPATNRTQSGRRIMHIAQAVTPRLSKAAAARASSKAADDAEKATD